jgi:hypothetical protein
MDVVPLLVGILWIVGMVLDHTRFAALWQRVDYHPARILSLFQGTEGHEKLRDFPFLGRVLFSLAIVILAYGMKQSVLLSGVFFAPYVLLGIMSIRFLFTALAVSILSPLTKN